MSRFTPPDKDPSTCNTQSGHKYNAWTKLAVLVFFIVPNTPEMESAQLKVEGLYSYLTDKQGLLLSI